MNNIESYKFSNEFFDIILNNTFNNTSKKIFDTKVYVGLGIDFDSESFSFSKEPISKFYTVLDNFIEFTEPINGIIRNKNAIEWPIATVDWTTNEEEIKYIGLYYKNNIDDENKYKLFCVLSLLPSEKVYSGDRMLINSGAIQIKLATK